MEPPKDFITSLREHDKIEAVVVSVGFDDLLAVTARLNLPHLDNLFVVTTHADAKTQRVCEELGATAVLTDTLEFRGKTFAKGAGLNAGLCHCQYRGWRLILDADIVLPDHFRRVLLNYTHLDDQCVYGADRVDVVGLDALKRHSVTQWGHREEVRVDLPIRARVVTRDYGYLPLGYFQLFHAACSKHYPSTAGGAGLDDVIFSQQWPLSHRRLLPSLFVYHLCTAPPTLGENWDGTRRSPRLESL